jgi:transcriptional regulator with XRE-family HTH domain
MRSNSRLGKTIRGKIQKLRHGAKLTQEELADKVGISRVYMGYLEQGRNTPSLETLEKMAKVLRTSPSTLLK